MLQTKRLLLRKIEQSDAIDLFEMDSDPEVHLYLENNPVTELNQINQVIEMLQKQYEENGIARWAVVDKSTLECIGWAGLKYFKTTLNKHTHFYELGYRFKKKHWGKGYATESSNAVLEYGFQHLNIESIFAYTDPNNANSIKVLTKLGFDFKETFDNEGDVCNWYELTKKNWQNKTDQ